MDEINSIKIAKEPLYILHKLIESGYDAYLVGGAVRDTLIDAYENSLPENLRADIHDLKASDYDFTTSATPEEIQKVFPENFYENKFGTVGVAKSHLHQQMGIVLDKKDREAKENEDQDSKTIDLASATKIHESLATENYTSATKSNSDDEVYEITTYRSDGEYKDHRRPESVEWGQNLEEDLSRRDFTINAMAISVSKKFLKTINFQDKDLVVEVSRKHFAIIDYHDGLSDLKNEIIKTVGNPNRRFNEDALRLLRAIRFSVQLNMQIDNQTYEAIINNSKLITHVSWERIRDEFLKMLASDYPKEAIEILDETGLLEHLIPELLEGKMVMQGGHHISDVWNHSLDALSECPSPDPIVRLATLLHDIAKPQTHKIADDKPTFYKHEVVGARTAKSIAQRLRLSKHDIDRIFLLVRFHMFHYQPENSDASIRRFMRKVGLENINDILDLREADRLGSGARKTSWRLEEMKQRMVEQLHQPFSIGDLKINGNDLMDKLKLEPGPQIGKILEQLFELVLENPELNNLDSLLEEAKKLNN